MDFNNLTQNLILLATQIGLKLVGAVILFVVGRMLINFGVNMLSRALSKQLIDQTVITYFTSAATVVLNITLIVAILGFFGVQTTTFAALLAAAGIAIGTAWSGLLSNFAAGAFLVILRPFKVGDFISAGGITGTVTEIGMFVTVMHTPDNIKTFIGNNKIFSDNIQNFSANEFRRVDLVAQLDHSVDPKRAINMLKERLMQIPNVKSDPAPEVDILNFTSMGPVLAVRPYTNNTHYWQVYFEANKLIRDAFGEAGFATPKQQHIIISERHLNKKPVDVEKPA